MSVLGLWRGRYLWFHIFRYISLTEILLVSSVVFLVYKKHCLVYWMSIGAMLMWFHVFLLSSTETSSFEQRCVQRKGLRLNCRERFVRFCQICQICRFRFVRFIRFADFRNLKKNGRRTTDGRMDQRKDQWTDTPSYRDAWTHLKTDLQKKFWFLFFVCFKFGKMGGHF